MHPILSRKTAHQIAYEESLAVRVQAKFKAKYRLKWRRNARHLRQNAREKNDGLRILIYSHPHH